MKKIFTFLVCFFLILNPFFSQTPGRVKDIYVGINNSNTSLVGVPYGIGIIFSAADGIYGSELWFSDGSTANTNVVKDINPGTNGSSPGNFFLYNSKVLFTANDGVNGSELWISDGTLAGTMMIKDINPGSASGSPAEFIKVGTKVLFTASTAAEGKELWVTDGTTAGTMLVKDIWPGISNSLIVQITNSNLGYIYFVANDGTVGEELWKSDGTPAGTSLVKDILPGSGYSNVQMVKMSGNKLFFMADNGVNGKELWATDGTTAGTLLTKDINAGTNNTTISKYIDYNNKLVFTATDPTNGMELWESDGTTAGTVIKSITSGSLSTTFYSNFYQFNNDVYFMRRKSSTGSDTLMFYKITNSVSNTNLIQKYYGRLFDGEYYFFQTNGNKFVGASNNCGGGSSSTSGQVFFVSDGTPSGSIVSTTRALCFGNTYDLPSIPYINNTWIYPVSTSTLVGDYELNYFAYASGSPTLMTTINSNTNTSFNGIASFGAGSWIYKNYFFNNAYYFLANDGSTGSELWKTDGTASGTNLVLDIYPGSNSGPVQLIPGDFTAIVTSNNIYFYANDGTTGRELWAINAVVGIKENAGKILENVFIYPNPAEESIQFNLSPEFFNETKTDFVIYNSMGQVCKSGRLNVNRITISDLADGVYTISLKVNDGQTALKFVKN